jgi:hypothetical protein
LLYSKYKNIFDTLRVPVENISGGLFAAPIPSYLAGEVKLSAG